MAPADRALCRFECDRLAMKVMKSRGSKTLSYSVFYEQASEGGYVAFVPTLPGCHTQGETLEETESNVKEAIALYLDSLATHGEAIPEGRYTWTAWRPTGRRFPRRGDRFREG